MPVPLTLKIFKGSLLVGTKEFTRDIIKIGRLSSAHLSLEDDKISRIHSVIQVSADDQLSILDMGSAEGTFVNGKRVSKGLLVHGDEITLGGTRLVLELGASATDGPGQPVGSLPAPSATMAEVADIATRPAPVRGLPPPPPGFTSAVGDARGLAVVLAPPANLPDQTPRDIRAVEGRRRRESAPIAGVNFSHRGRAADLGGQGEANDDAVEVRVFWGETLIGSTLRTKPPRITIGEDEKNDFVVPAEGLSEKQFSLITTQGGEVLLHFTKVMEGEFQLAGQAPVRLADLVARGQARPEGGASGLTLPSGSFAWLSVGNLRIEVELTTAPKTVVVPFWEGLDYRFLNLLLLLSFAMLAFIISAATFPFDTDTTADDLFRNPHAMAKFVVKPPEKIKNAFIDKLQKEAKKGQEKGEQAEKRAGDEGKMGHKNMAAKKDAKSAPKAIDINAKEIVKNSALLRALGTSGGLSTILGHGGLGGDMKGALGNMFGPTVGDAGGLGGLGLRGSMAGGGGFGNTIGIGEIGTKGRGGGLNGYGVGVGALGKKSGSDVAISSGNPVVEGSMDKELIRRVIHEHRNQVRYCYESELQRHPGLNGKVTIKFVIGPAGQVQKSGVDNSSLGNSAVENCIVARVYQWQFPKPKGGGIVQVSYPFLLKESGD